MTRIYQPYPLHIGESIQLTEDAGQHVGVVLRMQPNERITLFCGDNREYQAIIEQVRKNKVQVLIQSEALCDRESPLKVRLAQAISKGDRMDFVIQKAVEMGVVSIVPLITERCAVRLDEDRFIKKLRQWQGIIIAACEQCKRNVIPEIVMPVSFGEYLKQKKGESKLILHPEDGISLGEYQTQGNEAEILVGPEGGFSPNEVEMAKEAEFASVKLGPRVLRTETAAIVAISLLQAASGDL